MLDKGFFRLAKNVSLNSNHRCKIGCVIVKHGKPVSVGFNHCKTHPIHTGDSFRKSIHAEVSALLNCDTTLHGAIAYIYRETKDGKPALARPCNYCYQMLLAHGIKNVYYTIEIYPYWKKERIK